MKNLLCFSVILGCVLFTSVSADAQHLYLGARVGANLANQSYNSLPAGFSNDINSGLLIGAQIDIPLDNTWSLSLQGLYDQKGTNQKLEQAYITTEQSPEVIVASGTSKIDFNYLEVPLYIKMMFGGNVVRPYVFAGPSFGIFLNGSQSLAVTSDYNGATESTTSYQSISTTSVRSPDISAIAGAGISLAFSSNAKLFADVAYAFGLVNIAPSDNTVVKTRDIRLAAGILFPLD